MNTNYANASSFVFVELAKEESLRTAIASNVQERVAVLASVLLQQRPQIQAQELQLESEFGEPLMSPNDQCTCSESPLISMI